MSVGRREFLKLIGVAASSAALPSVEWVAGDDRTYHNEALGLSFELPEGWRFVTRLDYALLRDAYRLPGGDEAKEQALAMAGKPLVALSAGSPFEDRAAPSIIIWVEDDDPNREIPATLSHRLSYDAYGRLLADFAWETLPASRPFGRFSASRCTIRYVERYEDALPRPVRLTSHMLRHGTHWYTFNFVDVADGWAPDTVQVFERFERTIAFG